MGADEAGIAAGRTPLCTGYHDYSRGYSTMPPWPAPYPPHPFPPSVDINSTCSLAGSASAGLVLRESTQRCTSHRRPPSISDPAHLPSSPPDGSQPEARSGRLDLQHWSRVASSFNLLPAPRSPTPLNTIIFSSQSSLPPLPLISFPYFRNSRPRPRPLETSRLHRPRLPQRSEDRQSRPCARPVVPRHRRTASSPDWSPSTRLPTMACA